jgi:hypothetical protein
MTSAYFPKNSRHKPVNASHWQMPKKFENAQSPLSRYRSWSLFWFCDHSPLIATRHYPALNNNADSPILILVHTRQGYCDFTRVTNSKFTTARQAFGMVMASASATRSTMPGGPGKSITHTDAPLTQSRETGDVNPESRQGNPVVNRDKSAKAQNPWAHLVAGG